MFVKDEWNSTSQRCNIVLKDFDSELWVSLGNFDMDMKQKWPFPEIKASILESGVKNDWNTLSTGKYFIRYVWYVGRNISLKINPGIIHTQGIASNKSHILLCSDCQHWTIQIYMIYPNAWLKRHPNQNLQLTPEFSTGHWQLHRMHLISWTVQSSYQNFLYLDTFQIQMGGSKEMEKENRKQIIYTSPQKAVNPC